MLRGNRMCDSKRVTAIGSCFGGTVELEIARSGADIAGVVSFHGGLDKPIRAWPPCPARMGRPSRLLSRLAYERYQTKEPPALIRMARLVCWLTG